MDVNLPGGRAGAVAATGSNASGQVAGRWDSPAPRSISGPAALVNRCAVAPGGRSGDRGQPFAEATGVALLRPGKRLEPFGDLVESLVACGAGKSGVHLGVLVGLALDGGLQIVLGRAHWYDGDRIADLAQEVEVSECVTGLAFRNRAEQSGDVGIALHIGLLGEVQVPAVGLALAGERLFEILLGLGVL